MENDFADELYAHENNLKYRLLPNQCNSIIFCEQNGPSKFELHRSNTELGMPEINLR